MKLIYVIICGVVFIVGGALVGRYREDQRIAQSCRDPDAVTMIDGEQYICLTPNIWNGIVKALHERGA